MFTFKPVTIRGLRFTQVAHHRNGVYGDSFYCATAHKPAVGNMLITYFPNAKGLCISVYCLDLLPDITFGVNSWRGDEYIDAMKEAIKAFEEQRS